MWINGRFLLVLTAFKIPKFEKTAGRYGIWVNWTKISSSRPNNVTSTNNSKGLSLRVCFWNFISASSLRWIALFRIFMFIVQKRILNFDSCELSPCKCHLAYDSSYKQCMLSRGHVYVFPQVTKSKTSVSIERSNFPGVLFDIFAPQVMLIFCGCLDSLS